MCRQGYTQGRVLQGHFTARDIKQHNLYFEKLPVLLISTCFNITIHLSDFCSPFVLNPDLAQPCVVSVGEHLRGEVWRCREALPPLALLVEVAPQGELGLRFVCLSCKLTQIDSWEGFHLTFMPEGSFSVTKASKSCYKTSTQNSHTVGGV